MAAMMAIPAKTATNDSLIVVPIFSTGQSRHYASSAQHDTSAVHYHG